MAPAQRLIGVIMVLSIVAKATSNHQLSPAQYLLAGLAGSGSYPLPAGQPAQNLSPKISAIANLAASLPVPKSSQKPPCVPKASQSLSSSGLDTNVLNNLAIALQLLIVSNILNAPVAENSESPKIDYDYFNFEKVPISPVKYSSVQRPSTFPVYESAKPLSLYSFESQSLPNANFLGSSSVVEPSIYGSAVTPLRPSARTSMTLMSPYEALGPNSPYSDPVSSVYTPDYSKKDLRSPYAAILAAEGNRDLFSVTDFY